MSPLIRSKSVAPHFVREHNSEKCYSDHMRSFEYGIEGGHLFSVRPSGELRISSAAVYKGQGDVSFELRTGPGIFTLRRAERAMSSGWNVGPGAHHVQSRSDCNQSLVSKCLCCIGRNHPYDIVTVCGVVDDSSLRLSTTNGITTEVGVFPWHANLWKETITPEGPKVQFRCSATIVQTNFVVTAAHCVVDDVLGTTENPRSLRVTAGNSYRDSNGLENTPLTVQKVVNSSVHKILKLHSKIFKVKYCINFSDCGR